MMEAYKKLKARKSKHTHIKPKKEQKKAPHGVGRGAGQSAPTKDERRSIDHPPESGDVLYLFLLPTGR